MISQESCPSGGAGVGSSKNTLEQEISLGMTLVSISMLFILCQSVKIIPDVYELICEKDQHSNMDCPSTPFIDTIIRYGPGVSLYLLPYMRIQEPLAA